MSLLSLIVLAGASLCFAACGAPGGSGAPRPPSPGPGDSGIQGQVLAAPAGPQAPAGASPAATAGPAGPVRVEVRAMGTKLRAGNLVTAVQTDAAGRFRISLPPGQYVVSVVAPGRQTSSPGVPVTVQAHQYATVTLQVDIGLR